MKWRPEGSGLKYLKYSKIKKKKVQPRILYPAMLSFKKWRQNKDSQINKNGENLLPADPSYKKY